MIYRYLVKTKDAEEARQLFIDGLYERNLEPSFDPGDNCSDGNVKIVAEGEMFDIDRFCKEIDVRNFLIRVTRIERGKDIEIIENMRAFISSLERERQMKDLIKRRNSLKM